MSQGPTERELRWRGIFLGWLLPLGLTSLTGYVCWAGTLLVYDARGGNGPLAPLGGSPLLSSVSTFSSFFAAPIGYALATWLLGVRGAVLAALGIGVVGPLLWGLSPWSSVDAEARYGYYDEGRGWIAFGLIVTQILSFAVVVPITYLIRWGWRRRNRETAMEPVRKSPRMSKLMSARVTFLPTSEGGRSTPAVPGMRPHLKLGDIFTTCVVQPLGDEASFALGRPYDVTLELVFWDELGHLFKPDEQIELFDGSRVIARGKWTIND